MRPGQFPKSHLVIAGVLGLSLCSFVVAKFSTEEETRFSSEQVLLDLQPAPATLAPSTACDKESITRSYRGPESRGVTG